MLKKQLIMAVLGALLLLASCASTTTEVSSPAKPATQENDTRQIELISEENQHRIGKEEVNTGSSGTVVFDVNEDALFPQNSGCDLDTVIPENRIVHSLADDSITIGVEIQEISVIEGGITPGMIVPNGVTGILTQEDGSGWKCKKGDSIAWTVEKYPLETGVEQSIIIGIIKDGVLYEGQVFTDSLEANYNFDVAEDGNYYIYFISAAADPLSLKEGDITLVS